MISSIAGITGGFSESPPSSSGLSGDAIRPGVSDAARSPNTDRLSYLRQSFSSQGFSPEAQTSCLHHGDPKPTPIMAPVLLDGQIGASKGIGIPLRDL